MHLGQLHTLDNLEDWSEILRSFRQRNNLKQEAAASLLGVSQAYVSKVENGAVQPSSALLRRLATLNKQPDHRPTRDLLISAVRYSPFWVCLLACENDRVAVVESSQSFLDAGYPFTHRGRTGVIDFDLMDEEAARALGAIVSAGAFDGRFGLIETIWCTRPNSDNPVRRFKTLFSPLRTDTNEWLLQASIVEISEDAFYSAKQDWDGIIRYFKHDEEPGKDWK